MGNPHSLAQGVRPSYAPPGLRMQNATFIPRLAPFPQAYAWGYHLAPATRADALGLCLSPRLTPGATILRPLRGLAGCASLADLVHGAGHGEGMGGGAIIRRGWRGWRQMR